MTRNCEIAFEALADYIEDRIDTEERARLEAHLAAGCPSCERTVMWLRRVVHLMKTDVSVAPPPRVIERARSLFWERHHRPSAWPKRIAAFLMFDSGLQVNTAGVRSAGATIRQLLYCAQGFDVDVLVEETQGEQADNPKMSLTGQILPRGDGRSRDTVYEVIVTRGQEPVFSCWASPLGEFTVDDLPHGKYDLHFPIEEGELVVEGLEV